MCSGPALDSSCGLQDCVGRARQRVGGPQEPSACRAGTSWSARTSGGWSGGGACVYQAPSIFWSLLQRCKPGVAIVIVQTRDDRPRTVQSPAKVTQPGIGGQGSNPGLPDFLSSSSICQALRFPVVIPAGAVVVTYRKHPRVVGDSRRRRRAPLLVPRRPWALARQLAQLPGAVWASQQGGLLRYPFPRKTFLIKSVGDGKAKFSFERCC